MQKLNSFGQTLCPAITNKYIYIYMSECSFIIKIYLDSLSLKFPVLLFLVFLCLSVRASGRRQEFADVGLTFILYLSRKGGGICIHAPNLNLFTLYRVRCNCTVYLTKLYFWIHAECTAGCIYEQGRVGYRHCSSLWVWLYRENWYPNPCTVYSYIEYSVLCTVT